MQCRLSWGELGVTESLGVDCADSYMPVLLGNYLESDAMWVGIPAPTVLLVFLYGCCDCPTRHKAEMRQIAIHPVVKRNEPLRLRHAGVKDARH